MARLTLKQLSYNQHEASRAVPVGTFWRHQSSGKIYEITGHAICEEHQEPRISYRPAEMDWAGDDHLAFGEWPAREVVFSRRLSKWFEQVEWESDTGNHFGPRFIRVTKIEQWVDA